MTQYDLNISEMIDNELSLSPYQSLSNRSKRYFKRNIIKMYTPVPVYKYHKSNPSLFYYFLRYYFIVTIVHFIFSFLKIY